MQTRKDTQLQLSIWRPVDPDRRYLCRTNHTNNDVSFVPIDYGELLEQVYAWDSGPDDVFDACSPAVGKKIRETLIEPFTSDQPPSNRSVRQFHDTVNRLLSDSSLQGGTHWTVCKENVQLDGNDDINLKADLALVLLQHFNWVARVFVDVPQASVMIR